MQRYCAPFSVEKPSIKLIKFSQSEQPNGVRDHDRERMITMTFVKAAQTTDLPSGEKKKITLEGKDILLTNIDGSYYAVDNTCPHMGGSLYNGNLEGKNIVCPKHGSVFDVTNGEVVEQGKLLFMKVKVHNLHSYPVKIEGADLLIGME